MSATDAESKRMLRRRMAATLGAMSPEALRIGSERAWRRAVGAGVFADGSTVLLYAPIAGVPEVDLTGLAEELVRRGCRVCMPRLDAGSRTMAAVRVGNLTTDLVADTASGLRGLRVARPGSPEIAAGELDVVVVPGVAFDRTGARLGRGAGYYDRFLAGLPGGRARRVAFAFDEQVVERVPMEAHDERVGVIVTPTEVIEVSVGEADARG